MKKPLDRKNYGSIGHLPSSRMGPSDHHVHPGQEAICTVKARDKHDVIIVTEKVDGSNVGIARIGDNIHALGRAGYLAQSSKYKQHQLFADWVRKREDFWRETLHDGQRLVGEWLAQAHSTRYNIHDPFFAFDLISNFDRETGEKLETERRAPFNILQKLCNVSCIQMPRVLHIGSPLSVDKAMELHLQKHSGFHPEDGPEGVVYRVERQGEFDFMAKWVRPDKVDGKYLPEMSGKDAIWNWWP